MANTTWSTTDKSAGMTLSNGNLTATLTSGSSTVRAADRQASGKFYWEVTLNSVGGTGDALGMLCAGYPLGLSFAGSSVIGVPSVGFSVNGNIWVNGVFNNLNIGALANGNIVCFAVDLDASLAWIRIGAAGNWNASAAANPATGVGGFTHSFGPGMPMYPAFYANTGSHAVTANFGDTAFTGTVPSGFTSGFTAGTTIANSLVTTQAGVEEWAVSSGAAMQVTQAGVEEWAAPNPAVQLTQIMAEHWATGSPAVQLTQALVEQWGSVQASYNAPPNATFMISGSRAGVASVVFQK